jgi:hypothetical protein
MMLGIMRMPFALDPMATAGALLMMVNLPTAQALLF